MKKNVLFILLLIVSKFVLISQEPILNSHYFKEGVSVEYQPVMDSIITHTDYESMMVWDYSKITKKDVSYKRRIVSSKKTPYSKMYPESNFVIVGQDGDYVYLNIENSKTEFIAFVPPDSSYHVYNYQPWSISQHPMNYGDTLQTPIARYIKIGDRTIFREGKVTISAIGYGLLKLPNKEYKNVLKIKEVQVFYNPTRTTYYKATTYHWLSNETNFPLMSCNEIIDRNSKGEEQKTRFAQYLVNEENTNINKRLVKIENEKPDKTEN